MAAEREAPASATAEVSSVRAAARALGCVVEAAASVAAEATLRDSAWSEESARVVEGLAEHLGAKSAEDATAAVACAATVAAQAARRA